MPLADSLTSIARSAAATASRTAARAADVMPVPGFVRGAVRGVAHALAGETGPREREARAGAWSAPTDPVPPPEPTPLHEAVATEPKPASRREAHGGPAGRHGDDWRDELAEEPGPVVPVDPAADAGDEPLIDPGVARAVRTEAEVMRRAARPAGGEDA
ncbi:hypothetical protein [Nocardioides jiangxiensis]|uniref:Uncharacterized protein n=1 Tax=Nocardioides jiangxiensis TaxID=3064524 RepID=A0ABT9AXV6_9ACTN|nr:hypothetical protein [Nocardioides sp. WY-20]MDO7867396.1 hypothetical protein [Nocardioides sp. WY-20]